ncbi:MAG: GAF and ANTAR domain-containing protein [Nitriliruptoraceae bacterium]
MLEALAREPAGSLADRLCSAALGMLGSTGVGIAMLTADGHHQTLCATGLGVAGEELQLTLGEGPTYEAYRQVAPVLVDDVAVEGRWPLLGPDAEAAGIQAMFAFPLRSGAAEFGVLTLYRDVSGPLGDGQYGDGLVFARVTLDLLLMAHEEDATGTVEALYPEEESGAWEVHQATGMVSVQLGISLRDAIAMLRGHAFASGRSISDTAGDVVAGRLQLESV